MSYYTLAHNGKIGIEKQSLLSTLWLKQANNLT